MSDGSYYPTLISIIYGQGFARGFYNMIVFQGTVNHTKNNIEKNGYHWNLEQIIDHEAIHCYQYNKLGFWNSNPIAEHANWKLEGYPEYISRQNEDQQDLHSNIKRLIEKSNKDEWAISFEDNTISPTAYNKDWLLVQYSLDINKLSY